MTKLHRVARRQLLDELERREWWAVLSPNFREIVTNDAADWRTELSGASTAGAPSEIELSYASEMACTFYSRIQLSCFLLAAVASLAFGILVSWNALPTLGALFIFAVSATLCFGLCLLIFGIAGVTLFTRMSHYYLIVRRFVYGEYIRMLGEVTASANRWENMSWQDLEFSVARLLRGLGYDAKLTSPSADGGVDIHAVKDGLRIVVQCKQYKCKKVGPSVVRELIGTLSAFPGSQSVLVAPFGFSNAATKLAQDASVQLWDLPELIAKEQLIKKTDPLLTLGPE